MSPMDRFLASVERRAYRTALLACGQHADALDIVQDSMLKLVQAYHDRPQSEWPALFHRILHNRITDWQRNAGKRWRWLPLRSHSRANDDEDADAVAELADEHQAGPLQQLTLTQDTDAVMGAIETLPWRQQQALLLRVWEGFDTATTASIMDCSEGSVKTHVHRAQQTLRQVLQQTTVATGRRADSRADSRAENKTGQEVSHDGSGQQA